MRTIMVSVALLVVAALTCPASADDWFDLENCAVCKHLAAEKDLLKNTHWETYKIGNGMLTVMVIQDEYKPKMQNAHRKMEEVIARLQQGVTMPLCGFCNSYGELMRVGAKQEKIETSVGKIGLLTSDDPAVVSKIHQHADRTIQEYKKMKAAEGKKT
jgi:hypothetical protein